MNMYERLDAIKGYLPGQPEKKVILGITADGKLESGIPAYNSLTNNFLCADPDGHLWIVPGLIDIHVHGGKGITFGEHPQHAAEELQKFSLWAASNGVTGFLCSIAAPDRDQLLALVEIYAGILGNELPGAECLGLHLEGPFLSDARRGAFRSDWLHAPTIPELEALLQAGKGWIRQVTIAPEIDGANEAARYLKQAGVVAALGHTDCDYERASQALAGDFGHVTHLYNAMSTFSHFTPGAIGAVLTSNEVTAELIADGFHASPGALRLAYRCLGPQRVVLITDAMAAAGMPDGVYELIGSPITVKDGKTIHPETGKPAGSTATLNQCVRNMVQLADVPFAHALNMGSLLPARVIHLDDRLGSHEAGKDASFAVVDLEMNVQRTVVKGRVVFDCNGKAGSIT